LAFSTQREGDLRRCIKQQPRNLKWPTIADQLNKAYLMGIGTRVAQCWPHSLSDDGDRVPYKGRGDSIHQKQKSQKSSIKSWRMQKGQRRFTVVVLLIGCRAAE
jgi:hypothetical protein